jgi:hypothetical protein
MLVGSSPLSFIGHKNPGPDIQSRKSSSMTSA